MDLLIRRGILAAATALLAVGGALGVAGARHVPAPTLAHALRIDGDGPAVVAVVQPDDCDSRLEALAPWHRAAERAGVRLVVRVPGAHAAVTRVARRLEALGWRVPVAAAGDGAARGLRALGHRETPLLAVLDADGRVAFAAPFPETPDAVVTWHALAPLVVSPGAARP